MIPLVPEDEDTFAAVEATLSGGDIGKKKKKKRKIASLEPLALIVASTSLLQEESSEPEDPASLSRPTKRRHDATSVSVAHSRANLRLKYPARKLKVPSASLLHTPPLTIDLERTPLPSSTGPDITPPPPPPL